MRVEPHRLCVVGGSCAIGFRNDHHARSASEIGASASTWMISIGVVGRTLLSDSLDTQCAPSSTHRLINSTSAIVNRSPLGGMISDGSFELTSFSKRLLSAFP